jgi:hypothetical protein
MTLIFGMDLVLKAALKPSAAVPQQEFSIEGQRANYAWIEGLQSHTNRRQPVLLDQTKLRN